MMQTRLRLSTLAAATLLVLCTAASAQQPPPAPAPAPVVPGLGANPSQPSRPDDQTRSDRQTRRVARTPDSESTWCLSNGTIRQADVSRVFSGTASNRRICRGNGVLRAAAALIGTVPGTVTIGTMADTIGDITGDIATSFDSAVFRLPVVPRWRRHGRDKRQGGP